MSEKRIVCRQCGAQNRIPIEKPLANAKCGRCHAPLQDSAQQPQKITLRCGKCHTKNRLPVDKIAGGAKCGRCSAPIRHTDLFHGRPVLVTGANFEQTVHRSPLPVLLYAWAPWCSVCGGTGPMVDQLAMETKGKVRIGKINIDANQALADKFHILSVPAFLIFDAGQLKAHLPGAVPKHELLLKLAPHTYGDPS
ncbi:thioredoxin domain-containing protein [Desulfatitalea alkaliphila]|uniref:Thioredoxin domain-containing protein n=1 Tax=Desulfatitalea alkaliphila TaxID=2929485 RepID=A0AA41UJY5_9BACT|nr:thioredoxin domain-containing protein [Desulfatitalea alkaliphila]MCJ8500922.1 thioredoxin domain-containing protein [Desulfatitalea alkaliphila]